MKIIDLKISNGFRRMKAVVGTDAEMARILGLSRAHIGRILKGVTVYLEDETWARIEKTLSRYIHDDDPGGVEPLPIHKIKDFPVISEVSAAMCNTAFCPIADWADEHAEGRMSFREGRSGDFVLRISGGLDVAVVSGGYAVALPSLQTGEGATSGCRAWFRRSGVQDLRRKG